MTTLLLGGTGQIGHELRRELAWIGPIVAPTSTELDLRSADTIREAVRRIQPTLVVNAAGYTAVDAAESDASACAAINRDAPATLAEECRAVGVGLVHFSTDYVFDGAKGAPYVETDEPRPLSVYGRTKLDGEKVIAAAGGAFLIFRTSWVYAARGKNFVLTMLRLARERAEVSVVSDQIGAPTSARAIATGVSQVLRALGGVNAAAMTSAAGVYHMTAGGSTTWYDFARRILDDDPRRDQHVCRELRPISTAEYPTAARRPAHSVLDNSKLVERFDVRLPSWEEQWSDVNADLT